MNLWEQVLARVETKVNRHSFYTWFKPTTFGGEDGAALTVRVPNSLFKDWLTKHYSAVISEAMAEIKRGGLTVTFVADAQPDTAMIALSPEEIAALEGSPVIAALPVTVTAPNPAADPHHVSPPGNPLTPLPRRSDEEFYATITGFHRCNFSANHPNRLLNARSGHG